MKATICLLVIVLLFTSLLTACGKTTSTTTGTTTTTKATPTATPSTTAQANWWDKFGPPKYGGTLNMAAWPGLNQVFFDPYLQSGFGGYSAFGITTENPFYLNWYVDRNTQPLLTGQENNLTLVQGALIDSWKIVDSTTVIAHVRQGVHWWNKPPANGRQLLASDIVTHYGRIMGWNGGKPNPVLASALSEIESVTAQDDQNVVFKLKHNNFIALCQCFCEQAAGTKIEYPLGQDVMDYQHMIGTGPYWVKEYVPGASITYERNPDYWAYDERYPQNRLPYFDQIKVTAMPDITTSISALRTGKIDILGGLDWRQADTLTKSNPELLSSHTLTMGYGIQMRVDQPPFDNINVRKAIQMAINLPLLAKSHYGGTVSSDPAGIGTPGDPGWYTPFNQWPKDLKDEYTYNPDGAKKLLADAGYSAQNPLKFRIVAEATADLEQLQIFQSMLKDIGVEMTIDTVDPGAIFPYAAKGLHQAIYFYTTGMAFPKQISILWRHSTRSTMNFLHNKDATLDAMIESFFTTTTEDEAKKIFLEVEQYCLRQHYDVLSVCPQTYTFWSPNLMGYSGETTTINISNWISKLWKK